MDVKKRWVLLGTVLLLAAPVYAQTPYEISERIGTAINAEERAYFGLFPDVEAFSEARAFAVGDSVEIIITHDGEPAMQAAMPRATAEALGRFVETFERHDGAFRNPDWQWLRPYVRADVPVPHVNAAQRDVRLTASGRRYDGALLVTTDSLVLVHPVSDAYDWRLRDALVVRATDIERVEFEPKGLQRYDPYAPFVAGLFGALLGSESARIGGENLSPQLRYVMIPLFAGLGYEISRRILPKRTPPGSYAERLGSLHEHAAFRDGLEPYDLPPITELEARETAYPYEAAPPAKAPGLIRRWYQRYGLVSVGFMAGLNASHTTEPSAFTEYFRGIGELTRTSEINNLSVTGGLDLSIRLLPWVRVGGITLLHNDEVLEESDRERVNLRPARVRGYAELVLPSPQVGDLRFDLGIGMGVETNSFSVHRIGFQGGNPDFTYRLEDSFSNTYWQGTVEVFTSRYISYFMRYTQRSFSHTLTVPGAESAVQGLPGTLSYQRDPHDVVMQGYSDLFWGTRLHF